jgi:hypothetical protein
LPISVDGELTIIAILHLHVEGRSPIKAVSGTATPVVAGTFSGARHGVQCCGATTAPVRFKPINLQAVTFVVLTHVAVVILAEATASNAGRDRVDVWNHTLVRRRHIEIEFNVASKQIECCFSGGSAISLDVPTAILDLHRISIRLHEVTSVWAVQVCGRNSEDVRHECCLHD